MISINEALIEANSSAVATSAAVVAEVIFTSTCVAPETKFGAIENASFLK